MVVLAGIMISGSTCTPDCCVPGTMVIAVNGTALEYDYDATLLVGAPLVITVEPEFAALLKVTGPNWFNLTTMLPSENFGGSRSGTITILAANGDKLTVSVKQKAAPIEDVLSDQAVLVFGLRITATPTPNWGTSAPGLLIDADNFEGDAVYTAFDFSGLYTPVFGDLTAEPDDVILNGGLLDPDLETYISIGLNYFVKVHPYIYKDGILYVSTLLLMFEGANGPITLKVDGVTTVLPFEALDHTMFKISAIPTVSPAAGSVVDDWDDYWAKLTCTGHPHPANPYVTFPVTGTGIAAGDPLFTKMDMTYYNDLGAITRQTSSYNVQIFSTPLSISTYVFPWIDLADPVRIEQSSDMDLVVLAPGVGDSYFNIFTQYIP